jgi:hypothetical protein
MGIHNLKVVSPAAPIRLRLGVEPSTSHMELGMAASGAWDVRRSWTVSLTALDLGMPQLRHSRSDAGASALYGVRDFLQIGGGQLDCGCVDPTLDQ